MSPDDRFGQTNPDDEPDGPRGDIVERFRSVMRGDTRGAADAPGPAGEEEEFELYRPHFNVLRVPGDPWVVEYRSWRDEVLLNASTLGLTNSKQQRVQDEITKIGVAICLVLTADRGATNAELTVTALSIGQRPLKTLKGVTG